MKKFLKITFIFIVFWLNLVGLYAQKPSIISDSIYSSILKEQRNLKIKLPEQYKPESGEKYDVIYLLDGEWSMDLFSYVHNFAKGENYVPSVILVAVNNTYVEGANMRDRDFLPQKVKDNKLAGGADNFLSFLKNELIPFIDKKYPANGDNSLFGHSYGGLFTMYAFLTEPQLFSSYYSSDPSFWWNDNFVNKLASKKFENTPVLERTLWINGIVETFKNMGITTMDSILKTKAPKKLRWKAAAFPNETHNSVRLKGIYDGLKFSYDGHSNKSIAFHPMGGILLKDKPTRIFLAGNYQNVHFTTNGSEPDTSSKVAERMFEISGPAKLVVKSIGSNKKYGSVGKGNFEIGETVPAIQKLKNAKKGGLKYSYYDGKWDKLPDFSKLKPVKTGIADSTFNIKKLQSQFNFGCVLEGFIKIETDGYYIFGLDSDDGSKFFLGGKQLIENDGLHGMGNLKSYIVPLQKGFYPVKIEFFQKEGGLDLQWIYLLPGTERPSPIPFELQYIEN